MSSACDAPIPVLASSSNYSWQRLTSSQDETLIMRVRRVFVAQRAEIQKYNEPHEFAMVHYGKTATVSMAGGGGQDCSEAVPCLGRGESGFAIC